MQDVSIARFNLLSYRQIGGFVIYSIELRVQGQIYLWEARYSALKDACQQFPNANVKFPPKNSIKHLLSQIRGSQKFLLERFNFMKEYFDAVSSNSQLRFNKAFLQIYRHLQQHKIKAECSAIGQKPPVIKGRKLQPKQQQGKGPLYIVNQ